MPAGFRVARGYVEVVAEVERDIVRASATAAGDDAGRAMGESMGRSAGARLRDERGRFMRSGESLGESLGEGIGRSAGTRLRDERGRFKRSGESLGESLGEGAGRSAGRTLGSVLSGHLPTIFSNPYILGAAAAAGALIAPAIGAGIAGGLIGGAGLGAIAGGLALVADRPEIKKAATSLKNRFMDIDTTDLEAQVLAAQERLAAARRIKNKDAVKEAKRDLRTLQADLDKAQAYNEKNFSLKDAAGPLIQPAIKAMGIFEKAADRIIPKLGQMFAKLDSSGAIEALAAGLVGLVENALPGMLKLVEASGPFLVSLGPGLEELGKGISFFAEQVAAAGPDAAVFFRDLLGFLAGQIAMWGVIIRFLSSAYTAMRNFFTSIPGWVSSATSTVRGWWDALWAKGVTVVNWLGALPGRIGGFIGGIASRVEARGAAVLGWFQALPGRIWAFLTGLPARGRALFVQMFDAITFAIGFGIGMVVKYFAALPGRVYNAAVGLIARGRSLFTQLRSAAVSNTQSLISSVVSYFANLPGRAYNAAVSIISRVRSVFASARSAAMSMASSLVSSVVATLRALPGRAAGAVAGFASAIAGRLRAAVGSARSIGADIIRGVISGINSMIGAAVSAARRAVGNIVSGAKSALGIGSPSKVMAREVGRWMLPGLTRGVEGTVPAARRAMGSAVASVVPTAPGMTGSAGSGALSGPSSGAVYYFAPGSIVLDASRIKSIEDLARMINNMRGSARAYYARTATVGVR